MESRADVGLKLIGVVRQKIRGGEIETRFAMIGRLELVNYRGFEHYTLAGLARVNLLVGKNNSGKTSILEAVDLLATEGDLDVLKRIARRRGEDLTLPNEDGGGTSAAIDVSHFFHGRQIEVGTKFVIIADNQKEQLVFKIATVNVKTNEVSFTNQRTDFDPFGVSMNLFVSMMKTTEHKALETLKLAFQMSEEGVIDLGYRYRQRSASKNQASKACFVGEDSLDRAAMSGMWNHVMIEGMENDVVNAMRIVDPKVSSVAFLSEEKFNENSSKGGILVGYEGSKRRYPLGSLGEGMRRMLATALALAMAQDGILLIDEVDTGLHYSIMGDMWVLLIKTAIEKNIQVFVTTHSFDCVRGLDLICRRRPELAGEVSLQKIDTGLNFSVSLDAREIKIAVDQEIEVR